MQRAGFQGYIKNFIKSELEYIFILTDIEFSELSYKDDPDKLFMILMFVIETMEILVIQHFVDTI